MLTLAKFFVKEIHRAACLSPCLFCQFGRSIVARRNLRHLKT